MTAQTSSNVFVHPSGLCESRAVGSGTRIWAFAHIMAGAVIGCDVNIGECSFVENDVVIGNRVTIKNHVAIWDGLRIESDVFVGPGVCFTNDMYPRSKRYNPSMRTIICRGASLGAGVVITPGVTIGEYAMVAAAAVVTRDVPPFAMMMGNPARQRGQVCICGAPLEQDSDGLHCTAGDWHGTRPDPNMRCGQYPLLLQDSVEDVNLSD